MLLALPQDELKMPTSKPSKKLSGQPSAKLTRLLMDLTPEQRAQVARMTAKLLAIRARKATTKP